MKSLDVSLGAVQVGYALSTLLFGVSTMQLYFYLRRFPKDPVIVKALTVTVWLGELGHQLCCGHIVHWVFVGSFGTARFLLVPPPKSFVGCLFFNALVGVIAQGFFTYRLWRTTKGIKVVSVLIGLVMSRFALSLTIGGIEYGISSFAALLAKFKPLLTAGWVCSAVTDLLLTVLLSYDLHARRSGIHKTSKLIDRLIVRIVATGMLTSIAALLMTIFFLSMDNLVWVAVYFIIPRLFSNSMMASLNSRMGLRRMDTKTTRNTISQLRVLDIHHDNDTELQPVSFSTGSTLESKIERPPQTDNAAIVSEQDLRSSSKVEL